MKYIFNFTALEVKKTITTLHPNLHFYLSLYDARQYSAETTYAQSQYYYTPHPQTTIYASDTLMAFKMYQIPPDFVITQLHHDAALIYEPTSAYTHRCPCCHRNVGSKQIPICSSTDRLMTISDQIPLYFSAVKAVFVLLLFYMAALVGQLNFSSTVQPITFHLEVPSYGMQTIQLGFVDTNRSIRFAYFCSFTLTILLIRGYLKKCKYQIRRVVNKISNRSAMLSNVHRQATVAEIKQAFNGDGIQKIVLTYCAKSYSDCLQAIFRLKKQLYHATHKNSKDYDHINTIRDNIQEETDRAKDITDQLRDPNNRLDFVFLTFQNEEYKERFMTLYQTSLLSRLFYKCCTCYSKSAIRGQRISVMDAPDPEDIDWLNLQQSYWTKKVNRIACFYMSFAILLYGIMFQYQIGTLQVQSFYSSIIKSALVFVINFFIVSLLNYTTYDIEKHETNTNKILSLVKKLTLFIFLNLSMSPLVVYVYSQYVNTTHAPSATTPLDDLCFSVLVICLGNIVRPVSEYFNVERIRRYISFKWEMAKGDESEMTQEEANLAFEPIPFPIASFYSMLISSLLLTSFFLSCFQLLIVTELVACGLLFLLSKTMLLRVCKEPIGLSNEIGILGQRMLAFAIYIYWIGDKTMYFFLVHQQDNSLEKYIANYQIYDLVELGILLFVFLLSPKLMSLISHKLTDDESLSESLLERGNMNKNRMTYEQVNSIQKIEAEYFKFFKAMQ